MVVLSQSFGGEKKKYNNISSYTVDKIYLKVGCDKLTYVL